MANRPPLPWPEGRWRALLREGVRRPAELLALLGLDRDALGGRAAADAHREFPLRVPRGFVARMRRGDPRDPLLLQVLPIAAETREAPGFTRDPLGERALAAPGRIRKYRGRVLLLVTGACAVHCRYCFRRHFPYGEAALDGGALEDALAELAADPTVREAILSGGDPLALPDRHLSDLARRLEAIPHLERLRVHTRLPVVLPERVDDALLRWLTGTRLSPVVVVHANHPAEIDDAVATALSALAAAGVTVLNQSVLLAGVNDDPATLAELSERLFAARTLPYYLHLLDPVAGAVHFRVPEARARTIWRELAALLPGYLVPRLVREDPGGTAKTVLGA